MIFFSTRHSVEPSPYFRSFEAMLTYIRAHNVSGPFNYWTGSHEAPIPYTPEIPF